MAAFNEFIGILKTELLDIARNFGDDIKEEILSDGQAFAVKLQSDLERWSKKLAEGSLSREDFSFLVKAKKDLAEMEALKQKGLAEAKIDKLKSDLIESVIGSTFKLLG